MQIEISEETKTKISVLLSDIPNGAERAFTNAMNRALSKAKTTVFTEVQSEYAIKKKVLDEFTRAETQKATPNNVCGIIRFAGTQIPLYKYNLTSPKAPMQRAKVMAGQKTATAFEHVFVAKMKSGHLGIFERSDKESLPIKELMGSSMQSMAGKEETMGKVIDEASKTLDQRLEHEVHRLLNGYGGK